MATMFTKFFSLPPEFKAVAVSSTSGLRQLDDTAHTIEVVPPSHNSNKSPSYLLDQLSNYSDVSRFIDSDEIATPQFESKYPTPHFFFKNPFTKPATIHSSGEIAGKDQRPAISLTSVNKGDTRSLQNPTIQRSPTPIPISRDTRSRYYSRLVRRNDDVTELRNVSHYNVFSLNMGKHPDFTPQILSQINLRFDSLHSKTQDILTILDKSSDNPENLFVRSLELSRDMMIDFKELETILASLSAETRSAFFDQHPYGSVLFNLIQFIEITVISEIAQYNFSYSEQTGPVKRLTFKLDLIHEVLDLQEQMASLKALRPFSTLIFGEDFKSGIEKALKKLNQKYSIQSLSMISTDRQRIRFCNEALEHAKRHNHHSSSSQIPNHLRDKINKEIATTNQRIKQLSNLVLTGPHTKNIETLTILYAVGQLLRSIIQLESIISEDEDLSNKGLQYLHQDHNFFKYIAVVIPSLMNETLKLLITGVTKTMPGNTEMKQSQITQITSYINQISKQLNLEVDIPDSWSLLSQEAF